MVKSVLIFPGQGAQKVGMGKDLADRFPAGLLATAEPDGLVAIGVVQQWREAGAFVRTVAERLLRTQTAGAPEVLFSCLDVDAERRLLCDDRFAHHFPFALTAVL